MSIIMTKPEAKLPTDFPVTTDHIFCRSVELTQPQDGYRFGSDAVLLAASINTKQGRLLDMGAGVGAVGLGAGWRHPELQITAVEKDPFLVQLLLYNIQQNHMDGRIRALAGDVSALPVLLHNSFDHVVANPPFHQATGTRPPNKRKALANIGDGLTLSAWVECALAVLKPKGRLTFIIRADRGDEVITALRNGGGGEIVQFPVWSYHGSPAVRLLISARKGVQGVSALLSGIVLHQPNGEASEAATKIMRGEALQMEHPSFPSSR